MKRRSWPLTLTIRVWLVARSRVDRQATDVDAVGPERRRPRTGRRRRRRPGRRSPSRTPSLARAIAAFERSRRCSGPARRRRPARRPPGAWSIGVQRWSATTTPAQTTGRSAGHSALRSMTRSASSVGDGRGRPTSGLSIEATTSSPAPRPGGARRGLPIISSISRDGQDLALDQGLGQPLQLVAVLLEQAEGALVGLAEDAGDLLVDDLGGVLGVVAGLAHLAAEEGVLVGRRGRRRGRRARSSPTA